MLALKAVLKAPPAPGQGDTPAPEHAGSQDPLASVPGGVGQPKEAGWPGATRLGNTWPQSRPKGGRHASSGVDGHDRGSNRL